MSPFTSPVRSDGFASGFSLVLAAAGELLPVLRERADRGRPVPRSRRGCTVQAPERVSVATGVAGEPCRVVRRARMRSMRNSSGRVTGERCDVTTVASAKRSGVRARAGGARILRWKGVPGKPGQAQPRAIPVARVGGARLLVFSSSVISPACGTRCGAAGPHPAPSASSSPRCRPGSSPRTRPRRSRPRRRGCASRRDRGTSGRGR